MPTQFESPTSSSDQEFTFMAIGMVAGAIPGIIIGLLLALWLSHAAMWVSITGGLGIVLGLMLAKFFYKRKSRASRPDGN
ncbi:MAG: hypothetical protein Q4C74_03475 [Rothia sp. (in: high G+C Gram-positive bacteria)]|nr:hypothetical protein [Rothia sp. (in: high G+C Gram-positive bacteria)]